MSTRIKKAWGEMDEEVDFPNDPPPYSSGIGISFVL
jgi:hypothetical protein